MQKFYEFAQLRCALLEHKLNAHAACDTQKTFGPWDRNLKAFRIFNLSQSLSMYIKICRSLNLMHFHMGNHLWATIFVHAGCRGFPPLSISKAFILPKKTWTKSLKHHHLIPHHDASSVHINLLCGPGLDQRQSVWFNLKIINPHEMQGMPSIKHGHSQIPHGNPWNLFHGFGGSDISEPQNWTVATGDVPGGPFSTGFSETSETFTSSHLRHPSRVEFTAVETCGNIRGNHQQWLVFCVCWICIWYVCVCVFYNGL